MNKIYKRILGLIIILCVLVFVFTCFINLVIISKSSKYIDIMIDYNNYDYVIVLGAKVSNGSPSLMLKDRLDRAIDIYNSNKNIRIIVSGDSEDASVYDEVSVMYNYLIRNGVNSSNIVKDNYGISTYDSVFRMKEMIDDKNVIIVTQKYHLYRSVYIARSLDMDAVGVSAREYKYFGQLGRDIREILARVKDYFLVKFGVNSKY